MMSKLYFAILQHSSFCIKIDFMKIKLFYGKTACTMSMKQAKKKYIALSGIESSRGLLHAERTPYSYYVAIKTA